MLKIIQRTSTKPPIQLESIEKNVWIKAVHPSDQEMTTLTSKLPLDKDLLNDALDMYELPRLEEDEGVIYFFSRFVYSEQSQINTTPVLVAVGKDFVLTFSQKSFHSFEKLLTGKILYSTKKRNNLFLHIVNQILESYSFYLLRISKQVYTSEIKLEKISNHDIVQFVIYERVLNNFSFSLSRIHTIMQNILNKNMLNTNEEEQNFLEDIILKNGQLLEIAKSNVKSIANIREAYSTIMTNNLNGVIKLFTSLTVILTIPTIISSIYGMNVGLPFANNALMFAWILLVIIGLSVAVIFLFRANDWL